MDETCEDRRGYVYILEVKDIDLPVCKIGMTSRNPYIRCSELNKNSTGDFIWEVAYAMSVDDCKQLESLVHRKLEPLRQKKREFFNINAEVAYKAMISIFENQSEIKEITIDESNDIDEDFVKAPKKRKNRMVSYRKIDLKYTELLQAFTSLLNFKGIPFGQLNRPSFGISDGNEGVQWNLGINPEVEEIFIGINLEGKKYLNWPITNLILAEIKNPSIMLLKTKLKDPSQIYLQFTRDAWQVTSRPEIVEKYLGGKSIPMSEMNDELWNSILVEALGCLNEKKQFRGRNKQTVTLANKPKKGEQVRMMEVSSHLTIFTPVQLSEDIESNLKCKIELLRPVYEWMSGLC